MTVTNGYTTLNLLKRRLGIDDPNDDPNLEAVITGVSRMIDRYCYRRFYSTTADETRYYTAQHSDYIWPDDDVLSVTTLYTDADDDGTFETTWAATDYRLWPYNAALDGDPYLKVEVTPRSSYYFPTEERCVKIIGKFGYAATTPAMISEACLLQSERLFKRKDAPFGVAGSAEMGMMQLRSELDPDVKVLLEPFIRRSA